MILVKWGEENRVGLIRRVLQTHLQRRSRMALRRMLDILHYSERSVQLRTVEIVCVCQFGLVLTALSASKAIGVEPPFGLARTHIEDGTWLTTQGLCWGCFGSDAANTW